MPAAARYGPVAAALLLCAYANTFHVPFLWDDIPNIPQNPTLAHLASALHPPAAVGVAGRPLLNLSFAINFLCGGTAVAGYHAVNLAIHAFAAATLFGIARRTLPPLAALSLAALWALHPVQTEAVTYLSQRAEALMGLFYLLTLYAFIRATESPRPAPWLTISAVACAAGMLTKEPMVTAPLLVLLYDRTFSAGGFSAALRRRGPYYAALAATWLILAAEMRGLSERGVGLGQGVTWTATTINSGQAMLHYLRLVFWPHPLVFDYGDHLWAVTPSTPLRVAATVLAAAVSLVLFLVPVRGANRWKSAGFLGTAFFLLLLPTTSFIPILAQPVAEHRLYLALAPALALVIAALHRVLRAPLFALVMAGLALVFCAATYARNAVYRDEKSIWEDSARIKPRNQRAHVMLGRVLARDPAAAALARREYETALAIQPDYAFALNALALLDLRQSGREAEAVDLLTRAVNAPSARPEFRGNLALAEDNLGVIQAHAGRFADAEQSFRAALAAAPTFAKAHFDLALILAQTARFDDARTEFDAAAAADPDGPIATAARDARTHLP